jgi:methylated-DNA-[protein]-cysteine S-methyltransferase
MCVPYGAGAWGVGELWLEGGRLVWHELPRARTPTHRRVGLRPPPSRSTLPAKGGQNRERLTPEVENIVHRLEDYFAGERVSFEDVELDIEGWTPFQRALGRALRQVPYGDVVTYAELALLAGRPRAQRAAGTFCASNRFPLVLPCHRVVSSAGIGSYGSLGVDYKRRLLALEGLAL